MWSCTSQLPGRTQAGPSQKQIPPKSPNQPLHPPKGGEPPFRKAQISPQSSQLRGWMGRGGCSSPQCPIPAAHWEFWLSLSCTSCTRTWAALFNHGMCQVHVFIKAFIPWVFIKSTSDSHCHDSWSLKLLEIIIIQKVSFIINSHSAATVDFIYLPALLTQLLMVRTVYFLPTNSLKF